MSKTIIQNFSFKKELIYETRYLNWLQNCSNNILKIPLPGTLQVSRKNGNVFYRILCPSEPASSDGCSGNASGLSPSGKAPLKAIRKDDPLFRDYVKNYCAKKTLMVTKKCLTNLRDHAERYDPDLIVKMFDQFELDFGDMTPEIFSSRERHIQRWQAKPYKTNTREAENNYKFRTERGEMVRSKNECIAANILLHWPIPYKYEYPVSLPDDRTIFVDFKILSPVTLKEYYLEIFGRMDDQEYVKKNMIRINDLAEVGIHVGKNLLIAFDFQDGVPFNTTTFRAMIHNTVMQA